MQEEKGCEESMGASIKERSNVTCTSTTYYVMAFTTLCFSHSFLSHIDNRGS